MTSEHKLCKDCKHYSNSPPSSYVLKLWQRRNALGGQDEQHELEMCSSLQRSRGCGYARKLWEPIKCNKEGKN